MRLSATRIKTYLTCPRRYRYAYLDEIPVVPTAAVTFGRVMHQTLYFLHQQSIQQGAPLNLAAGFEEFDRLWHEVVEQEQPFFQPGRSSAQDYWNLADDIVRGYVEVHQAAPAPLAVEFPFEVAWAGHTLAGLVDRIDTDQEGLVLVDYKTSQRKPTPQDLKDDLQLTVYALAVEQMLQQPVARIVHYHLRDQTRLVTRREQADFEHLTQAVLPRFPVAPTKPNSSSAPRYGYWCRFCDFRELCQAEGPPPVMAAPQPSTQLQEPEPVTATASDTAVAAISATNDERPAIATIVKVSTPAQRRAILLLLTQLQWSEEEVTRLLQARFSQAAVAALSYAQAASLLLELQRKAREKKLAAKTQ